MDIASNVSTADRLVGYGQMKRSPREILARPLFVNRLVHVRDRCWRA
jgi:hypothetical protein